MNWSNIFLLASCFIYNVTDIGLYAILIIELPNILKTNLTMSCTNSTIICDDFNDLCGNSTILCKDEIQPTVNPWINPGVVFAMRNAPSLLFSIPIGIITSRFDSILIFVFGLFMHALGSAFIAGSRDFVFLMIGSFCDGTGCAIGGVTYPDMVRKLLSNESERYRMLNACGIARVTGYSLFYLLGPRSCRTFGYEVTFSFISVFILIISVVIIVSRRNAALDYNELKDLNIDSTSNLPIVKENQQSKCDSFKSLLKYDIILCCLQVSFMALATSLFFATAPSRLQFYVGFTPVQNGTADSAALVITFLLLIIQTIVVIDKCRMLTFMVLYFLLQSAGLITYPFATAMPLAVFGATTMHTRLCMYSLLTSMLVVIARANDDVNFAHAMSIFVTLRYGSQFFAALFASEVVGNFGFTPVYWTLGCILFLMALSALGYCQGEHGD